MSKYYAAYIKIQYTIDGQLMPIKNARELRMNAACGGLPLPSNIVHHELVAMRLEAPTIKLARERLAAKWNENPLTDTDYSQFVYTDGKIIT